MRTYLRDSASTIARQETDATLTVYALSDHSPFSDLVSSGSPGYFYSNDLRSDYSERRYKNSNPNYLKYYRATAIAPISNPGTLHNEDIIGFLCVDNPSGGFDDNGFRTVLETYATTIFYVMRNAAVLQLSLTIEKKEN